MKIAVFRPDDDRLAEAVDILEGYGITAVADPMLEIDPTGNVPRSDADIVVFTSRTGVELAVEQGWEKSGLVCAIGEATGAALRAHDISPDRIPSEFSSTGIVRTLRDEVAGVKVEVARSDSGSEVLLQGLVDAGAYVHETVLYELSRPPDSGRSAELAARGELDGALFTSTLTVEHFLEAAEERGSKPAAVEGLQDTVVGAIGTPTSETATAHGIEVDVVADVATFERLASAVVERLRA